MIPIGYGALQLTVHVELDCESRNLEENSPKQQKQQPTSSETPSMSTTRTDNKKNTMGGPKSQRQPTLFACLAKSSPGSTTTTQKNNQNRKIFCDLDGVLVDFNRGVAELNGSGSNSSKQKNRSRTQRMWAAIQTKPHFYRDLEWTVDGNELWEVLRPLGPHILTGVSQGSGVSRDKFDWCQRELCVEVTWRDMAGPQRKHTRVVHPSASFNGGNDASYLISSTAPPKEGVTVIITCWSANKHCECRPGDILIDDRPEKLREAWESAGGIFVHHVDTVTTLRELREMGVLDASSTTTNDDAVAEATTAMNPETEECRNEVGTEKSAILENNSMDHGDDRVDDAERKRVCLEQPAITSNNHGNQY